MRNDKRFSFQEFGFGLALGLAIGSLMGLVFAPQSGVATREQIRSGARGLKGSVEDLLDSAKKNLDLAAAKIEAVFAGEEKGVRRKLEKIRSELEDLKKT